MELTERQKRILAEIIHYYCETGEPVGSKNLKDAMGLNISSATIRNEMSELAELGFLEQPHTSSGRIPSGQGYRFYVDVLMRRRELDQQEKQALDRMIPRQVSHPDQLLDSVAQALANLTSCAALSTTPADDNAAVKTVQVIPTGSHCAIIVLLTTSGLMRSCYCRTTALLTPELIERFMSVVRAEVVARPLSSFQPASLQTIAAGLDDHSLALAPMLSALFDLLRDAGETELKLQGEANLLSHREFGSERVQELLRLFGQPHPIIMMLEKGPFPVNIMIGEETKVPALSDSSMVVARYSFGGKHKGQIGIIGPQRIPYERIVPRLEYLAQSLGQLFAQFLEE